MSIGAKIGAWFAVGLVIIAAIGATLPMSVSSSEPARTMIRCGRGSASLNSGWHQS